jgi:hypothetical protein
VSESSEVGGSGLSVDSSDEDEHPAGGHADEHASADGASPAAAGLLGWLWGSVTGSTSLDDDADSKPSAARPTDILGALLRWRSRWEQRTMQRITGRCGILHAPGQPYRWDEKIGAWFEYTKRTNWLDDPKAFSTADEVQFSDWISKGCPDLLR